MKKFRYYQASLNLEVFLRFIKMFPGKSVNVLLSYAMLNHEVSDFLHTYRDRFGKIILDSGTWTLNKAKDSAIKLITLDNYMCYLMRYGHLYDFYINFDSDFTESGTEINQYNQMVLEDAGLHPVPVVHDIYGSEIDQYIKAGYKRIALGSSQIRTQRDMAHVMRRLDGTGIKIHTLGKSGFNLLGYFLIDSSDSAMWAREGGYGYISWLNPNRKGDDKTDRVYLEEFLSVSNSHKYSYFSYEFKEDFDNYLLNTFNLKYYDFFGKGYHTNKMVVNMYYYVMLEEEINKMHQKFGFRQEESPSAENVIGRDEITPSPIEIIKNEEKDMKNDDMENEQEKVESNKTEIILSKKQFKEFCTFTTIIKPYFKDLSINDGMFRMRSDDSSSIVETWFDYFKNMNLTILNTKEFVKKLSTLDKNTDIGVIVDGDHIIFQDEYQSLQVPNNFELIEDKILNNEEMESIFQEDSESSIPFIKERLSKSTVCNVNKIVHNFSTSSISIEHNQNDLSKGHFHISSWNDENGHYNINLKESFLTPMKKDHSFNFVKLPFIFNKSEMDIYFWIIQEDMLSLKFSSRIDNLFVNIYARSAFH